ncbi:ABC transporter substrate-binding protein [Sedimentibacter sp. zth1]|uniref:ABC transporter substrate-binding protein n=1 Tax=Sedimentibacter sp. zth1 TaxID=2816908 RepID=UPI001A92B382|nr:ABC transporter substrate-binding protein [Sedimentibacter sp. zth1]QSX04729.1 ABC transporter substrate-binding protein [Sedimentibacter sp. zth1]
MKKVLVFILTLVLVIILGGCINNNKDNASSINNSDFSINYEMEKDKPEVSGSITLGSNTQLTGNFWSSNWGNNAQDAIVKDLIHGYGIVTYKKETGEYGIDETVVKEIVSTENEDKTKTYKITINNNLMWNDNTKISAKDYVFTILFSSSIRVKKLGLDNTYGVNFIGYDDYSQGNTDIFRGVKLIDDYTFSLTIKAEKLPYYYDVTLVAVKPTPMHIFLPNVDIVDYGNGAKITGQFTTDVINKTVLNTETGYRYMPKVTCGPYQLDSFDIATRTAILKNNPFFIGDYNGQKPQIGQIILKPTTCSNQIDELITGTVDILPNIGGIENIEPALNAVDEGLISYSTSPRNGYGNLTFVCDLGPTQFVKVRQAIAHCLDSQEFTRQYSGGYASTIYSAYGLAQWMYQDNAEVIEKEFNKYTLNLEKAEELLIEDGWILNNNGNSFVKGKDKLRFKMFDGELMPLTIKHLTVSDSMVSKLIVSMLVPNMEAVGMKYERTIVDFSVLLDNLYGKVSNRQYNMMNLGTEFNPMFDPYNRYNPNKEFLGLYNNNYLNDYELFRLAKNLRETSSNNREEFSKKWLEFERRWNELLPDIPLYSDQCHAFYSTKIKNYDADSMWTFQYAILYAYLDE